MRRQCSARPSAGDGAETAQMLDRIVTAVLLCACCAHSSGSPSLPVHHVHHAHIEAPSWTAPRPPTCSSRGAGAADSPWRSIWPGAALPSSSSKRQAAALSAARAARASSRAVQEVFEDLGIPRSALRRRRDLSRATRACRRRHRIAMRRASMYSQATPAEPHALPLMVAQFRTEQILRERLARAWRPTAIRV